jgi:hypothetical protein
MTIRELKQILNEKVAEFSNPDDDYEEGLLDAYSFALAQLKEVEYQQEYSEE